MTKKRNVIIAVILLLAIGFAGVATMLRINGHATVGFDQEQFEADIIFTKSILDSEDVSDTTIIENGKKIKFETKKLTTVGESTVLDYTVTNKSNQYGARAHVKTFEYDPEYIRVENTPDDFDLLPQSNSLGKLTITLIKPLLDDKDTDVTIEIDVDPIDPGDVTTTTSTTTTKTTTGNIDDGKVRYDLTIDPDGGLYNGSTDIINTKVVENTEVTLDTVTKEGYIFSHWEVNEERIEENKIIITSNTTIKAIWIPISEAVARINDNYYLTVQSAFDAAKTNDEVVLLKDTEETSTNEKDIVLNLNSHKITGSITNTGTLSIDNGEIENANGSAITNTGTLTLGNNEGNVSIEVPSIIGTDIGIEQKGTLNFYDGVVEGKIGINGDVEKTPEEYFVFVDHNDVKDAQKVYLVKELNRAVAKTITNGTVYYFNLQDSINSSYLTGYKIYAIRDFEAPYELSVNEGETIEFDITGYNVLTGNAITNNGILTLTDSGAEKGELKPSVAITNNGTLNINDISISETTDANVIENTKLVNIKKSVITAKNGYAISVSGEASLNMDDESYLYADKCALYLHDIDFTVDSGNIRGIYIETTASLTIEGGHITGTNSIYAVNNKNKATMTGGTISNDSGIGVLNYSSNNTFEFINGNIIANRGINGGNTTISGGTIYAHTGVYGGTLTMTRGEIISSNTGINGATITISGGHIEVTSEGVHAMEGVSGTINKLTIDSEVHGIFLKRSNKLTVNDIIINSKGEGIYTYGATLNFYGGEIHSKIALYYTGSSNCFIYDGIIEGSNYGIYNTSYNDITIGTKDNDVKDSPVIIGGLYGIYNSNSTAKIKYYDGIIKGVTDATLTDYSELEEGMAVLAGEETIGDNVYTTNELTAMKNFLKVGDSEYNSFTSAINATEDTGKIEVLDDVVLKSQVVFPTGKTIVLDLKGYTLTSPQTLINRSVLTITDSSENKSGKLEININNNGIENNGTLTVEDVTIRNDSNRAIYSSGNLIIQSGNIIGKSGVSSNTMTMNGGEIVATNGIGLDVSRKTTLKGGKITASNGDGIRLGYYGPLTIEANENGTDFVIDAKDGINITYSNGVANMNSGTINAQNSGITMSNGKFNMNGGTINANNGINVTSSSTYVNVYGGTIKANNNGIISGHAEVTIGNNDGIINSTPLIIGENGVVNSSNSKFYFYDGIFRGTESAINGDYNALADNTLLHTENVDIDGTTYEEATLVEQENFLRVNGEEYNSLKRAVDAIETSGTIELIASSTTATSTTIPDGKTIIFDMCGNTLNMNASLINNENLILTDSSDNKSGALIFKNSNTILENLKNLTIQGGKIENLGGPAINNKANIVIEDGMVKGATYGIQNNGTVNLKGGTINGVTAGINNGNVNVEGGFLEGSIGVWNCKLTMSGGTIHTSSTGILDTIETNITGGIIISDNDYGIKIRGNNGSNYYHSISNVIIQSKKSGIEIGHYVNWTHIYRANANIRNVTINTESTGIDVISASKVNIYDSTINGKTGVYSEGTTTIVGGKISGTNYGVYTRQNNSGSGTITLGNNEDNYLSIPEIIGDKYGVYKESGIINFYDGIIKGVTEPIYGTYDSLVTNMTIQETNVVIEEQTYIVNILVPQTDFISNGSTKYNNLQTAINEANSGDVLQAIDDAFIFEAIEIGADKNFNVDLNGHILSFSNSITNNGTVSINNNSGRTAKIYSTRGSKIIINNGNFTLTNVTIDDSVTRNNPLTNSDNAYMKIKNCDFVVDKVVDNKGELIIEDSNIKVSASNYSVNNTGTASILNTDMISTRNSAIYTSGPLNVFGGTYVGSSNSNIIYANASSDSDLSIESTTVGSATVRANIFVNSGTVKNMKNNNIFGNIELKSGVPSANLVGNNIVINNQINRYEFIAVNALTSLIGSNNTINIDATGVNYKQTGIALTGNMELTNTEINIIGGSVACAIKTSGTDKTDTLDNLHVNIINSQNAYGMYIDGSDVTLNDLEETIIDVAGTNAYGVYINGGSFTMGSKDASETSGTAESSVSVTNPLIRAIGTTSGIGVRKVNGLFNYYDGKIIGSTSSTPDTTSSTEPYYEVAKRIDSETGYEYATLEYMR